MDPLFIFQSFLSLLGGVPLLFKLVVPSLAVGFVLAIGLALLRVSKCRALSLAAFFYIYLFRSTPLLVQIFMIYYGLAQITFIRESFLWQFLRSPYWCAILALTLNTAAYTGEIIRGGILSVPWGQIEAAKALGMSGFLLLRRITLPIATRQALPAYGNEIILMVKATSLAKHHHSHGGDRHSTQDHLGDLSGGRGLHRRGDHLPLHQLRSLARNRLHRTPSLAASAPVRTVSLPCRPAVRRGGTHAGRCNPGGGFALRSEVRFMESNGKGHR